MRSLDHINALDKSIKAWVGEHDPYSVRKQDGPYVNRPSGGPAIFVTNVKRTALVLHVSEPFPAEWSAFIGDAAHNLRSALDHLAFALNAKGYADANQGAFLPAKDAESSEFPIRRDSDAKFDTAALGRLKHAPVGAVQIIKGIQPYKRGQQFATDPLWLIHDLDRIDKHRQLVLSTVATHRLGINFFKIDGPVFEAGVGLGQPLDEGGELAYWVLLPEELIQLGEPKPKVEYDLDFTFAPAFGKGTPAAGWPVVETLRSLRDYVRFKVAVKLDRFL